MTDTENPIAEEVIAALSGHQVTAVGLALAALSMVGNGTFGIFGKLCRTEPDPVLFNSFLAVGVMVSSLLPLPLFYVQGMTIGWTWPGALAGCLLVVATLFSFVAISLTGLSNAQATWSCAAITVATLWGALGPRRGGQGPGAPVKSVPLTLLAMLLLLTGVMVINSAASLVARFCQRRAKQQDGGLHRGNDCCAAANVEPQRVGSPHCVQEDNATFDTESTSVSSSSSEEGSRLTALVGLLPALLVGVSGGSILAPAAYVREELAGLPLLPSFGAAAGVMGLLVGAAYWKFYRRESLSLARGSSLRRELRLEVILYGIASGFCWNAGNICQIIALHDLHMPYGVSYPILQCALVVAGLWGICVFGEVSDKREIAVFFLGVGVLLTGVVVLGLFGPGS